MVSGTPGCHSCHWCIAVCARLRQCDRWLAAATRHWHESVGEGYPPPREIGRNQPFGCPFGHVPAAAEKLPPLVATCAASDPHGLFRVPHRPADGESEAGGKVGDGGEPAFEVHGANGAPSVRQIADRGQYTPWYAAVMFVVWNPDRGVSLQVWQRPRWGAPGRAGRRCRRVLLAEDIQPRNVGAVPFVGVMGCPDVLGNQTAQRDEPEVVSLGFSRPRGCAEGVRPYAKWARMQPGDALAAEPGHRIRAAPAEIMPKERGIVVPDSFLADVARFPGPLGRWGFTGGHPEERYRSWDNRVTF